MGYTLSQVYHCYDNVVLAYKSMGFIEEITQELLYDSASYRETGLSAGNVTSRISLIKGRKVMPGFKLPICTLSIVIEKYLNGNHLITECHNQFYYIDDEYFTIDLKELKYAQDTSLARFVNHRLYSCNILRLDLSKIQSNLMKYIKTAIDNQISDDYSVKDIYFRYDNNLNRKLVVIIKRDSCLATESFCFNPSVSFKRA